MKRYQLYNIRKEYFRNQYKYACIEWKDFDFSVFDKIMYIARAGSGKNPETYDDCIIMCDTETSKEIPDVQCRNFVVAWTISVRAFDSNIVTLYGHKPSEFVSCIDEMRKHLQGSKTVFYWHNLSYDWVFVRQFCFRQWGTPEKQLNTKSHYPLFITFKNGIIFKDSLILAQRNLLKWSEDLQVEHVKAAGKWIYNIARNQDWQFTPDEIEYIEHDTLAGVECIQKTMDTLNKHIYSMPYTATGIPREAVRKIGKEYHARDLFKRIVPEYYIQCILEAVYHGGFTHANRHYISRTVKGTILAKDFASSYPFCMLAFKYPMTRFSPLGKDVSVDYILRNSTKYAFIFKLVMTNVKLKDDIAMPALQLSKCTKLINSVEDNGRILQCDFCSIFLNEIDLQVISSQYDFKGACTEVHFSTKKYLPRWFTDYVFQCFEDKCKLKNGDPVLYSIAKAKLNSLYGMCCQKPVKQLIEEDYETGEYNINEETPNEELYEKYKKKYTSILPYQWGVYVTSYAFKNLHELGSCVADDGVWLYSDTDSCYATKWDEDKVAAYNEKCKALLRANGYGCVKMGEKEFWLGVAEHDGTYSEFRTVGSKRYCCRYADVEENRKPDAKGKTKANKLKLTVAGVPKKGVACLSDNIDLFRRGFIFDGATTGKLQHTYYFDNEIWIDKHGNERADSIDLSPAAYELDEVSIDWDKLWTEDIEIQVYEKEGDEE
ncbi:MAG: hypothetical protein J6S67_01595 [Methanobrevibacter sp.]|nr:hypothetical protein [Methanobrevibacter sp.]